MKSNKMNNMATTSPRLLKFFASKNPTFVLLKLIPIIGFLVYILSKNESPFLQSILFVGIGIVFWSLYEYVTHRWIYHIQFKNKKIKWLFETFHIYHHNEPKDYRVLNAGLLLIYPLVIFFWGTFYILTSDIYLASWISLGTILYYFFYENIHYYIHYKEYKRGYLRKIQLFHLHHHHKNWNKNYGNTVTFWDKIFGTYDSKYKLFKLSEEQKSNFIKQNIKTV